MRCYISVVCALSVLAAVSYAAPATLDQLQTQDISLNGQDQVLSALLADPRLRRDLSFLSVIDFNRVAKVIERIDIPTLRKMFPTVFRILDNVIQNVTSQAFSIIGRAVLQSGGLGGGGGGSGNTESRVSVVLPSFDDDDDDDDEDDDSGSAGDSATSETTTSSQAAVQLNSRLAESDVRSLDTESVAISSAVNQTSTTDSSTTNAEISSTTNDSTTTAIDDSSSISESDVVSANIAAAFTGTGQASVGPDASTTSSDSSSTSIDLTATILNTTETDSSSTDTITTTDGSNADPTTTIGNDALSTTKEAGATLNLSLNVSGSSSAGGSLNGTSEISLNNEITSEDSSSNPLNLFTSPETDTERKLRTIRATDQDVAASGGNAPLPNEDLSNIEDDADRDKRYLPFGVSATADHGATGGSGNFLFDIIRLVAGSGATEATDEKDAAGGVGIGAGGVAEIDVAGKGDGYTEGIPGPITRLFVLANRGLANLVQDLILRLAQTSERIVNFKARLVTSLI